MRRSHPHRRYSTVSAAGAAPLGEDTDRSSVGIQLCSDPAGWLQVDLRPGLEIDKREPQPAIFPGIRHPAVPGAAARLSTGPAVRNRFDRWTTQNSKQLQTRGAGINWTGAR